MKWFAVQSAFRHRTYERDAATYEERVLLYRATTAEHAVARAKEDNAAYLDANPEFIQVGRVSVFAMNADIEDLDGKEVWSCLHLGPSQPEEFWAGRHDKYAIPEE